MVSCCKFLEYAEANKDIFKNQILVKGVYSILKKNPDETPHMKNYIIHY